MAHGEGTNGNQVNTYVIQLEVCLYAEQKVIKNYDKENTLPVKELWELVMRQLEFLEICVSQLINLSSQNEN